MFWRCRVDQSVVPSLALSLSLSLRIYAYIFHQGGELFYLGFTDIHFYFVFWFLFKDYILKIILFIQYTNFAPDISILYSRIHMEVQTCIWVLVISFAHTLPLFLDLLGCRGLVSRDDIGTDTFIWVVFRLDLLCGSYLTFYLSF